MEPLFLRPALARKQPADIAPRDCIVEQANLSLCGAGDDGAGAAFCVLPATRRRRRRQGVRRDYARHWFRHARTAIHLSWPAARLASVLERDFADAVVPGPGDGNDVVGVKRLRWFRDGPVV